MRRGVMAVLLVAGLLAGFGAPDAWSHAGVTASDPAPGATLGDSPAAVRLTFTEQPQASLSAIQVLGGGSAHQTGSPRIPGGSPLALQVPVTRLGQGVYTVDWRVVSAVDGHATSGSYRFGVGVAPTGAASTQRTTSQVASPLEIGGRWMFLAGLVLLIGGAVAAVACFGGRTGTDRLLAVGGWLLAALGLLLLAEAQRRTSHASLGTLLDTPVGAALIRRAVALGAAGAALLVAWRWPWLRRVALGAAAVAAVAAIAVHVNAGHAASGSWPAAVNVTAQVAHVSAVGVWIGGLAALVLGLRGAPSTAKAAAVRRFSVIAAVGLVVVVATGTLRAGEQLSSVGQLFSTGYGRAIVVKIVLIAVIAGLVALAARRNLAAAATDLGPLRRTSTTELGLAACALVAAAVLGTLAPPVAGRGAPPPALSVTGADAARTLRIRLTAASVQPGPNRFVARVAEYRARKSIRGAAVRLRFTPLDDPGVRSSLLALTPQHDGSYAGSGPNLTFDGRWLATALVGRGGGAVQVPLELAVAGPKIPITAARAPGRAPVYTAQLGTFGSLGYVRISPDPERAGPSQVLVTCFSNIQNELSVNHLVVTGTADDGPTRQEPVRRLGAGRFVASVDLIKGRFGLAVVARAPGGLRQRVAFALKVPAR